MIKPVGGPEPRTQGFNPAMPRGNPVGPAPRIMGTFHQGGTVPEDGAYKMKKGEKVLTEAQTSHLKHSFGLAQAHLAHDAAPQVEHKMPRKKIKEVSVRHAKGGHVATHRHHEPHGSSMHDTEHVIPEGKGNLAAHVEQNAPEAPPDPEEMGESGGAAQMEQAIGMK